MQLSQNQIHIWKINLRSHSEDLNFLYQNVLSPDERARVDRLKSKSDQKRSIISRGFLRKQLGFYLSTDPSLISFSYNKYGKPYLNSDSNHTGINFNVSHSRDIVLYAIAMKREIGIDVEYLKEVTMADKIVMRFFSETEKKFYVSQPEERKKLTFFTLWTRKEAYSKAMGRGIGLPSKDIDLNLTADHEQKSPLSNNRSKWTLYSIDIDSGYLAALVTEGKNVEICHLGPESHI